MDWVSVINGRQVLRFVYDGLERVVQPATFGVSTAGVLTLRACQTGGASNRGGLPGWRLFTVARIVDAELAGEIFADFTMAGYTKGDSAFGRIAAEH